MPLRAIKLGHVSLAKKSPAVSGAFKPRPKSIPRPVVSGINCRQLWAMSRLTVCWLVPLNYDLERAAGCWRYLSLHKNALYMKALSLAVLELDRDADSKVKDTTDFSIVAKMTEAAPDYNKEYDIRRSWLLWFEYRRGKLAYQIVRVSCSQQAEVIFHFESATDLCLLNLLIW